MIPSPARADIHRCRAPTDTVASGAATIPAPSRVSRPRSASGMARSTSSLMSRGGTTVSIEMIRMVASTPASIHR